MSTFNTYASRSINDPDNDLVSSTTITRFSQEGENDFNIEHPCILTRIAPAVTSGNSLITLPDDVVSIRRVAWMGYKLDPLPHRNFREVFQSATQTGRPFWYVFNNVGQNIIQLFPTPASSLSAATTNLWGSEIQNRFIVEYFRAPDFSTFVLPVYIRRRLLRSFVMYAAAYKQGPNQNVKVAKYFKSRYDYLKNKYAELLGDLHNKPRKLVVNGITASYYFPGQPILPIDQFGISVDVGE